jgi:hypothetical protein
MNDEATSVTISVDSYNASLFLGKISRLTNNQGLVSALRVEPGDSVKVKLDIGRDETINRSKGIIRKRTRARLGIDFELNPVVSISRQIMDYLYKRQKKIERGKGKGHLRVLSMK